MVCKRSLYCWKNGPCASDETRKQIWEDNIKFRVSLRKLNQSDHYWSFQISKNICLCQEEKEESTLSILKKPHSSSLQKLHHVDCTSITHDCKGLLFRNCFLHCPLINTNEKVNPKKEERVTSTLLNTKKHEENSLSLNEKSEKENSRKPLCNFQLINNSNAGKLLNRKSFHASLENVTSKPIDTRYKIFVDDKKESNKTCMLETKKADSDVKLQKRQINFKKHINQNLRDSTLTLQKSKKNINEVETSFHLDNNHDGSITCSKAKYKIVFPSKLKNYQNLFSEKQEKQKFVQKEETKTSTLETLKKRQVNHSSLWSKDKNKKYKKLNILNKQEKVLPGLMKAPLKIPEASSKIAKSHFKTFSKPQIKFYEHKNPVC